MILDVGCGMKPQGHVNTDIAGHINYEFRDRQAVKMEKDKLPNFVVCSGEYLPFRDCAFNVVRSSHVIEHTDNPGRFLRECKRVSRFKTIIICPHRYGVDSWRNKPYHKHVFSSLSFQNTGLTTREVSKYDYWPSTFIPLIRIPSELTITYYQKHRSTN